jgi:hypothetical protein
VEVNEVAGGLFGIFLKFRLIRLQSGQHKACVYANKSVGKTKKEY